MKVVWTSKRWWCSVWEGRGFGFSPWFFFGCKEWRNEIWFEKQCWSNVSKSSVDLFSAEIFDPNPPVKKTCTRRFGRDSMNSVGSIRWDDEIHETKICTCQVAFQSERETVTDSKPSIFSCTNFHPWLGNAIINQLEFITRDLESLGISKKSLENHPS